MSSFCPWKKNLDPPPKKCMTESKEKSRQISCALYLRSPPFITDLEAGFGCSTPIASPCSLHAGSNGPSAYHEQTSAFIGIKLCQTLSELHNPQTAGGFTKSGEFPSKDVCFSVFQGLYSVVAKAGDSFSYTVARQTKLDTLSSAEFFVPAKLPFKTIRGKQLLQVFSYLTFTFACFLSCKPSGVLDTSHIAEFQYGWSPTACISWVQQTADRTVTRHWRPMVPVAIQHVSKGYPMGIPSIWGSPQQRHTNNIWRWQPLWKKSFELVASCLHGFLSRT